MRIRYSLLSLTFLAAAGCGLLADPDRIPVAEIDGEPVRRGDLDRLLREMPAEERPHIQTRGDLVRVLESYVDDLIKQRLAEEAAANGEPLVPREEAALRFDATNPQIRMAIERGPRMDPPLSPSDVAALEQQREDRIDDLHEEMQGEAALMRRGQEAYEAGDIEISEEEYRREYDFQRARLKHFETLYFDGVYVPVVQEDAERLAALARQRIDAGEGVAELAAEYTTDGTGFPLNSALENDPARYMKTGRFWEQAAGAQPGDIVGPLFIRGWEAVRQDGDNGPSSIRIPDAYLVARITQVDPERPMTLEEAKPLIRPALLYGKMMAQIRDDLNVTIHEERLPSPSGYGSQAPRSVFDAERRQQPGR